MPLFALLIVPLIKKDTSIFCEKGGVLHDRSTCAHFFNVCLMTEVDK